MIAHEFTHKIISILNTHFDGSGREILQFFDILKYINIKTKAATRGAKSRASYANLYAIYVLVEDYLNGNFNNNHNYNSYTGAKYVNLLTRQRELPFGGKLQNHALNHRLNEEFKKYFPSNDNLPVLRDAETNRYWINELLIQSNINKRHINIALSIKEIIEAYIETRQSHFSNFIRDCEELVAITNKSPDKAIEFIIQLLNPNVDARIFEIVTYSILKYYYLDQKIYWGWSREEIKEDNLTLYKTGRTNANDGGIDFVMKPLGRFFQVTETLDAGKYFLDIDKVQRYPITFVVKSNESKNEILLKIKKQATQKYPIETIIKRYIESIEDIFNIPSLIDFFKEVIDLGLSSKVINEIVLQSRIEFNLDIDNVSWD